MTRQQKAVPGLHSTKTANFIDYTTNSTSDARAQSPIVVKIAGAPGHFITTLGELVFNAMYANGWEVLRIGDAFTAIHQQFGSIRLANFEEVLNFARLTGARLGDWSAS